MDFEKKLGLLFVRIICKVTSTLLICWGYFKKSVYEISHTQQNNIFASEVSLYEHNKSKIVLNYDTNEIMRHSGEHFKQVLYPNYDAWVYLMNFESQ